MSADPVLERLTQAHRTAQLQLRAATLAQVLQVTRGMTVEQLDDVWPAIRAALTAIITTNRRQSAGIASRYYTTFRTVSRVPGGVQVRIAELDRGALLRSLEFVGPIVARQYGTKTAITALAGASSRHVLNGGRQTMIDAIREDDQALGWERVTDGKPCAFCAMLASRGAVYKTRESGGFRSHDHCACSVEPRFLDQVQRSPRNDKFHEQWNEAQRQAREAGELNRGTSNDALNAFRRAYSP